MIIKKNWDEGYAHFVLHHIRLNIGSTKQATASHLGSNDGNTYGYSNFTIDTKLIPIHDVMVTQTSPTSMTLTPQLDDFIVRISSLSILGNGLSNIIINKGNKYQEMKNY